jgi:hypothetical protein
MNEYTVRHIGGTDKFKADEMSWDETHYEFLDEAGDVIHLYTRESVICVTAVYEQED